MNRRVSDRLLYAMCVVFTARYALESFLAMLRDYYRPTPFMFLLNGVAFLVFSVLTIGGAWFTVKMFLNREGGSK